MTEKDDEEERLTSPNWGEESRNMDAMLWEAAHRAREPSVPASSAGATTGGGVFPQPASSASATTGGATTTATFGVGTGGVVALVAAAEGRTICRGDTVVADIADAAGADRLADVGNAVAVLVEERAVEDLAVVDDAVAVAVGRPLDDITLWHGATVTTSVIPPT